MVENEEKQRLEKLLESAFYNELKKQFDQKSSDYDKLEKELQQATKEILELRQEKIFLDSIVNFTEEEEKLLKESQEKIQKKYREMQQEMIVRTGKNIYGKRGRN